MKTFAAAFALVSVLPGIFALTVNTPSGVVACQPIKIEWTDGTAPFFLSIIPAGQPSAPAIKSFPTQQGNSFTWNVDLPPNTGISISLKDSTGTQAYSDTINIQGSDASCANTSVSVSGVGGATGASSPAPTTGGAAPTTGNTSAGANSSGTTPKPTTGTTTGSGSSQTSNAASKATIGKFGVAGLIGLAGFVAL